MKCWLSEMSYYLLLPMLIVRSINSSEEDAIKKTEDFLRGQLEVPWTGIWKHEINIKESFQQIWSWCLIIEVQGKIIAALHHHTIESGGFQWSLHTIAVDEGYRKSWYASRLIQEYIHKLLLWKLPIILITEIYRWNRSARQVHLRNGFKKTEWIEDLTVKDGFDIYHLLLKNPF